MTQAGQTYYQPTPLDFALLAALPPQGVIGGVHWAGRPAKHVRQEINEALPEGTPPIPMSTVQARLRSMKVAGFCETYRSHGAGMIWAATPAGVAHLARREEVLGS